jgi:sugar phosphate isomerase/epimerase
MSRRLAAFQAIGRASQELLDLGEQEIKALGNALDYCRDEITAIEQICQSTGLEGPVLTMVQSMARSVDAERHIREVHKTTAVENARLRSIIDVVIVAWDVVENPTADGNRAAEARQRIRDALKGKVTT